MSFVAAPAEFQTRTSVQMRAVPRILSTSPGRSALGKGQLEELWHGKWFGLSTWGWEGAWASSKSSAASALFAAFAQPNNSYSQPTKLQKALIYHSTRVLPEFLSIYRLHYSRASTHLTTPPSSELSDLLTLSYFPCQKQPLFDTIGPQRL